MVVLHKSTIPLLLLIVGCFSMPRPDGTEMTENQKEYLVRTKRDNLLQMKADLFDRLYNQTVVQGEAPVKEIQVAEARDAKEVKLAKEEVVPSGFASLADFDPDLLMGRSGGVNIFNGLAGLRGLTGDSGTAEASMIRSSVGNVISQLAGGPGGGVFSVLRRGADSVRSAVGVQRSSPLSSTLLSADNPISNLISRGVTTVRKGVDSARTTVQTEAKSVVDNGSGRLLGSFLPNLGSTFITRGLNVEGPQPIEIIGTGVNTLRSFVPSLGSNVITRAINVGGSPFMDILGNGGFSSFTDGGKHFRNFASNQLGLGQGSSLSDLANSVHGFLG